MKKIWLTLMAMALVMGVIILIALFLDIALFCMFVFMLLTPMYLAAYIARYAWKEDDGWDFFFDMVISVLLLSISILWILAIIGNIVAK